MPTKVAQIIGGPALVQFAGASFYSKGDIELTNTFDTFAVEVDRFRKVDERVSNQPLQLKFTPAGEWEDLAVLYPYVNTILGDLITPARVIDASTFGSGYFLLSGQDYAPGTAVQATNSLGALPAGLAEGTLYYIGEVTPDSGQFALYDTRAHAQAGGATGKVAITDAGTGIQTLIMQEPLVIWTFSGKKFTFHNAAVVQMPNINASTIQTLLGEVTFEAFLRDNKSWADANSIYTVTDEALSDNSFDPEAIITQPYVVSWGSDPWANLATKEGIKIAFALQLEAIETDTDGVLTRRLSGIDVTATAQPMGISETQLMDKLLLQGAGAKRGRSLSGDSLNIVGDGVYIRLYGAALKGGSQHFSTSVDRIGELTWTATRTFQSGVPNPLFFVGTDAP